MRNNYLMRCSLCLALFLALATATTPSRAEGPIWEPNAGVTMGLEGGSAGPSGFGFRRSRLRLSAGADMRTDGNQKQSWGFRVVSEIEGSGTLGAELRYALLLSPAFAVFGGISAMIAPESLFGVLGGARFLLPVFGKNKGIFFEGSLHALPIGGDLPEGGSIVMWTLFSFGFHLEMS